MPRFFYLVQRLIIMKETLSYNTPNSEEILQQINQYEFARIWKKNLSKNNRNLIWGIFFTILASFMLFRKDFFGFLFLGFGLFYIFSCINYIVTYRKHKKTFSQILDKETKDLNLNSKDVLWEFTETYFRFQNYKAEFIFNWEMITYCILDDQYIYITSNPYQLNFILDKANIPGNNYDRTISYLRDKSKLQTL